MNSGPNILDLSDELLLLFAQKFKGQDLLNFALTCQRFSSVCTHLRKLNLSDAYNVFPADMAYFLKTTANCRIITECLFENCYWIPAEILSDAIQECVNVSVLRVANTRLSHQHLTKVFSKCTLICELSFSIEDPQSWVPPHFDECVDNLFRNGLEGESFKEAFELTELRGYSRIFNQLVKLDLYMTADPFLLVTLLRACESLESLYLATFCTHGNEDTETLDIPKKVLTPPGNLKSVILFFESSLSFDEVYAYQMDFLNALFLIDRVEFRRKCASWIETPFLECLWTNTSDCSMKMASNSKLYTDNRDRNIESKRGENYMNNHFKIISPKVKFVDTYYNRKGFAKFCRGNLQLRKLRLRSPCILNFDSYPYRNEAMTGLHEFTSLSNLRHLTRLSIDANILVEADYERRGREGTDPPCAVLAELVKCSLPLEELEILQFYLYRLWGRFTIPSSDLSLIAQLRLLKKLSLGKYLVDDGQFLVDILGKCSMLESLKLDLVAHDVLSYARSLCTALPLASNLKLLRLVLDVDDAMWPMGEILDAVSRCTSLVQLYLIAPSTINSFETAEPSAPSFSDKIIKLVCSLTKLLCLHCFTNVPESQCAIATKILMETVISKRPSLCVELLSQQECEMYSTSLPFVHSRPLVELREEFSSLPYEDDD